MVQFVSQKKDIRFELILIFFFSFKVPSKRWNIPHLIFLLHTNNFSLISRKLSLKITAYITTTQK
jgi:hypothetical protein